MTKRVLKKWHKIKGYEELYEVSDHGTILILKTYHNLEPERQKSTGLFMVTLRKNRANEMFYVHELVARHFIPNPNNYQHVIHVNRIFSNNHMNNLKWVSDEEKALYDEENRKNPITAINVTTPCKDLHTGIVYDSLRQACKMTGKNCNDAIYKIKYKARESRFLYLKNQDEL